MCSIFSGNYLVINVSPIEFGHCLYLPALYNCLPQIPTLDSLHNAIELILLSNTPAFRVGFNGLCAYCSLNHLHYHSYYLDRKMLLETINVDHLSGPCYILKEFPSKGFVFELKPGGDTETLSKYVYKLTNFLQNNEEPYNIYITRSIPIGQINDDGTRNTIRVYVWARKPTYGMKNLKVFHPALCELFGHLAIKSKDGYETITEEIVSDILQDITMEPFNRIVNQVKILFSN
uniref:GDP-D-glucose phosphorylase 1 n=1 Tax=Clastoptera arizonana TaxID=38151 RepID=A0A1B6DBY0_9HEMI